MRDIQYRKDFVRGFGELFASEGAVSHYESAGIERMEYDEDREIVTVYFANGGKKEVNVAMDSLAALAYDVLKCAIL